MARPNPDPLTPAEQQGPRLIALSLAAGGVITIALAIYLGATVSSALYAIALVSLVDFAMAWAYLTGRLGPAAQRRRAAEASGDVVAEVELDPSYNPYARED
jgi:hypothetical protein